MATITVDPIAGYDNRNTDFGLIYYGDDYDRYPSVFRVYFSADSGLLEFYGSNLRYDDGVLSGGTVTEYAVVQNGVRLVTISGLSIPATTIVKAANTASNSDDNAIIRKALSGDDVFSGGDYSDYLKAHGGNDRLFGFDDNDTLRGDGGNDRLDGGYGNDELTGGDGGDVFIFANSLNASANLDRITDFSHTDDLLQISADRFRGLYEGELSEKRFVEVSDPNDDSRIDSGDRFLYDRRHGDLYFDRDGSGTQYDPVKFAELADNTYINQTDIFVA